MPDTNVQLRIEIETEGAEQLTSLRRTLEQVGASGTRAFTRLDASLRTALEAQRRFAADAEPIFRNFFRRLLTGATDFRDAFKGLFNDLLDFFLRAVGRMVSTWLSGLRRMLGGASSSSFGGALGGLLPPLLSAGAGFRIGPGGTPPFFPPGGGGGSATQLDLLSRFGIDLRGLGPIPGDVLFGGGLLAGLFGVGRGSPALGAAGGAAAGFAVGGPIGAAIGGLAGLIGGIFQRGRLKRQATEIANRGFAEMRRTVEEFKSFGVDFDTALAQVTAIWQQMVAAWRQIGGSVGGRSIRSQQPFFEQIVNRLRELQRMRELRQQLLEALPIPEFQVGGLVRAIHSQQGRILAFLHEGEAVLNRRAVQTLGTQNVERLNQQAALPAFQRGGFLSGLGSPAAGAGVTVNLQPGAIVIQGAERDPREIAQEVIREIRRAARDQGLRRPV